MKIQETGFSRSTNSSTIHRIQTFCDKISRIYKKPAWQTLWKFYRHSAQKKLAFDKICRIFNVRIFRDTRNAFKQIQHFSTPRVSITRHKSADRSSLRPYSLHHSRNQNSFREKYINQIKLESFANTLSRLKRKRLFLSFLVLKRLSSSGVETRRSRLVMKENQMRILKKLARKIESKKRDILIDALYELIKFSYHKFMNQDSLFDKYRKPLNTSRY